MSDQELLDRGPEVVSLASQEADLQTLAAEIRDALRAYPHYAVVSGYLPDRARDHVEALARAVAETNGSKKVSFTKVRVDPAKAGRGGTATHYSRTHLPLAPHTDSSYLDEPHALIVFQMVVADADGGETILVPVEDLAARLSAEAMDCLREPVYPLGDGLHPILWGEPGAPLIRYYRTQIDHALADGAELEARHLAALAELDRLLDARDAGHRLRLAAGEALFLNNLRILHGRNGFSADSTRLLYRYRLHAKGLQEGSSDAAARAAAHFALAQKLEQARRYEDALDHYEQAVDLVPDDPRQLEAFGDLLLYLGDFDEATAAFRRCLALEPDNYEAGLALSSLLRDAGEDEAAAGLLARVMRRHPLVPCGAPDPDKATVLRIRGVERSAYGIWERPDGGYDYLLRGGHFSIRDLLDKSQVNLLVLNAFEDSLDSVTDLPRFDLILNTIACPDLKRDSLLATARFVDRYPEVPLINHPRRVLETTRARNADRLNTLDGVVFPKTERLIWDGSDPLRLAREVEGLGFIYPLLLRRVGTQTGQSVALLENQARLEPQLARFPAGTELYCIQYRDNRRPDGLYNKVRVFCIDGRYYPVANLLHDSWQIHSGDRYSVMAGADWTQARERAFLADFAGTMGAETLERLERIRDLVRLDFFGIDFTVLEDGRLFIFELNAAMRHNFDHAPAFPYTRPHLRAISQAFHAMVESRAGKLAADGSGKPPAV